MPHSSNKNIVLIEDHHEAYGTWKKRGFKGLPLVHLDAHIDFGFQEIKDIEQIFKEAKSLVELKTSLEKALFFKQKRFEIEKLTHIGNYIYPAIRDGIVTDFYWVIPGDEREFRHCLKDIKLILKGLGKKDPYSSRMPLKISDGLLKTQVYDQRLTICCLKKLPKIKKDVLLDIDTDFLVISSVKISKNTDEIGKRNIWIEPKEVIRNIRAKLEHPIFITIAYSVNGGYTPIKFKYLADELAAGFKDITFKRPAASIAFALFNFYWQKKDLNKARYYYKHTIMANPSYGVADNNYGPLYLAKRKYKKAEKEFKKILWVEPSNKYALCGIGKIHLEKKNYELARWYFKRALGVSNNYSEALFGLGLAEFKLKQYKRTKKYLLRHQSREPLNPHSHYMLGQIYEKERCFHKAIAEYKNALSLGLNHPDTYLNLLRLSKYSARSKEIVRDISIKFKEFKGNFFKRRRINLKESKIRKIKRKFFLIEKLIKQNLA